MSRAGPIVLLTGRGEQPGQGLRAAGRRLGWAGLLSSLFRSQEATGAVELRVVRGSPEDPWEHLGMVPDAHV